MSGAAAPRQWERGELLDLARGRTVYVRDVEAHNLTVPDWLGSVAGALGERSAAFRVSSTHDDDRANLANAWISSLTRPGELIEYTYRLANEAGVWVHEKSWILNLEAQPDVGGVLMITEELGPVEDQSLLPVGNNDAFGSQPESGNWIMFFFDDSANIMRVGGMIEIALGRTPEEIIGRSGLEIINGDGMSEVIPAWIFITQNPGSSYRMRNHMNRADGSEAWYDTVMTSHVNADGRAEIVLFAHDITTKIQQEAALTASHEELQVRADELRLLADEVPNAVFRADLDGRISFHNTQWDELVGAGGPVTRLQDLVAGADRELLDRELARMAADDDPAPCRVELHSRDGHSVLLITCRAAGAAGSAQRAFIGSVNDVTSQIELQQQAERDPLTGLLNRRGIESRLGDRTTDDPSMAVILFVDLDGFKHINDTFGHDVGDLVLVGVAERLDASVRPGDDVGRYGGDEFVVVCHQVEPGTEHQLVARLEDAIQQPVIWAEGEWSPGASIGWARCQLGENPADAVRRADQEMFAVKRQRRAPAA